MAFLKHTEFFDRLNELAVKIDDKEEKLGIDSLSWPEQVVDIIWTALGLIENGSFQYLVECQIDIGLVAQAYEEIGLAKVADLFKQAEALLATNGKGAEWRKDLSFMDQHEKEFDDLAANVLESTCEMERRLFEYVERNPQTFSRFAK